MRLISNDIDSLTPARARKTGKSLMSCCGFAQHQTADWCAIISFFSLSPSPLRYASRAFVYSGACFFFFDFFPVCFSDSDFCFFVCFPFFSLAGGFIDFLLFFFFYLFLFSTFSLFVRRTVYCGKCHTPNTADGQLKINIERAGHILCMCRRWKGRIQCGVTAVATIRSLLSSKTTLRIAKHFDVIH